jgi:hypothetical protein
MRANFQLTLDLCDRFIQDLEEAPGERSDPGRYGQMFLALLTEQLDRSLVQAKAHKQMAQSVNETLMDLQRLRQAWEDGFYPPKSRMLSNMREIRTKIFSWNVDQGALLRKEGT